MARTSAHSALPAARGPPGPRPSSVPAGAASAQAKEGARALICSLSQYQDISQEHLTGLGEAERVHLIPEWAGAGRGWGWEAGRQSPTVTMETGEGVRGRPEAGKQLQESPPASRPLGSYRSGGSVRGRSRCIINDQTRASAFLEILPRPG